jgi:hypothetical protein
MKRAVVVFSIAAASLCLAPIARAGDQKKAEVDETLRLR